MSIVRTHGWMLHRSGAGGIASPVKYGLSGAMPALTYSRVGSPTGTTEAAAIRRCCRAVKNRRNVSRMSSLLIGLVMLQYSGRAAPR